MSSIAVAAALTFVAPATAAEAALGPDAASCRTGAGEPAVLVNVTGFKQRAGRVRVQLYGSNPADFLAKGKKLRRIDLPVTGTGPMRVCVAVPKAGEYAIAVRHDISGNGSDWGDGGGFSRNPKISLLNLKPKYQNVAIPVGNGVKAIDVVLNYKQGLTVKPVA
ncbi:DUF2141 domain-containing protein [Sphingosinicella sp. LY1275]|uniref:DUF2141 domain-containing protein n=1 Tax=Sphingosinicella sp. LY1275 TaxID=3095379 RepID=UPI002ADEC14A|nr:DUF2141 domain-containing protein [Sphingosinicella sp. LY1275]MEA1015053.1 DUF2141 domain-containing protein [Sphingosinicella sp. LY1275]